MIRLTKMFGSLSVAVLAGTALAQDAPFVISGNVQNDAGVDGVKVVACSLQADGCKTKTRASISPKNAKSATFALVLPGPGPYQVLALKDMDGDGKSTAGDYLAIANGGNDVKAPAKNVSLKMFQVSPQVVAAADAMNGPAQSAEQPSSQPATQVATQSAAPAGPPGSARGLAGHWSQKSDMTEAVRRATLESRPTIVTSSDRYGWEGAGGFNLGGATQYSRTIMRDKYLPLRVQRQMTLNIGADGRFKWDIDKVEIDDDCRKTIRQQKVGRVTANGRKITFAVTGGKESQVSDCGRGPEGVWNGAIEATEESYDYRQNGGTIMIDGSGDGWLFRKGA